MNPSYGAMVQEVRPGRARVHVTELSGSGRINPTPYPAEQHEDPEPAVELFLSRERLELLCGSRDLSLVTSLEVCINTSANTLSNIGSFLPRLVQLKMNNSFIKSVRDLGTTLSHLQVLWMSRCHLQDLDSISTFSSLKELYLAFNNVSDLFEISMLDNLQLLDLEGNCVDDLHQVQYLGLCGKLQILTLEGNPVCIRQNSASSKEDGYSYRAAVRELVPQLRYLDNVNVEEDDSVHPYNTHSSAGRPSTAPAAVRPLSSPSSRLTLATGPGVFTPAGSRPGSSDSGLATEEGETSSLAPTRSTLTPRDLPIDVPERTHDLEEPDLGEGVNVFAELRARRELHSRRLEALEKERSPRILAIHHGGEDEADEDEEEGFAGVRSNSSDEDQGEETHCDRSDTGSLDSSFHSLSPDLSQHEALSPDVARLSLSPDATPSFSPPHCATSAPTTKTPFRIRARRLRLSQASSEHLPDVGRKRCIPQTATPAAETDFSFDGVQHLVRTNLPPVTPVTQIPRPPLTRALHGGPVKSGVDMRHRHETSKILSRPVISRPHTARAVLQKSHQYHLLQTHRGSSHPD